MAAIIKNDTAAKIRDAISPQPLLQLPGPDWSSEIGPQNLSRYTAASMAEQREDELGLLGAADISNSHAFVALDTLQSDGRLTQGK